MLQGCVCLGGGWVGGAEGVVGWQLKVGLASQW
jgi:hypothetical protein